MASNSRWATPSRNASHSARVKRRTAPSGFLLSRTPIVPSSSRATSTHCPPFVPDLLAFFHVVMGGLLNRDCLLINQLVNLAVFGQFLGLLQVPGAGVAFQVDDRR